MTFLNIFNKSHFVFATIKQDEYVNVNKNFDANANLMERFIEFGDSPAEKRELPYVVFSGWLTSLRGVWLSGLVPHWALAYWTCDVHVHKNKWTLF